MLEPITKTEAPTLRNLFELYAHDFSEFVPRDIGPNGRFDVPIDEEWWTIGDHFPFFIRHAGALAGFALIKRGSRLTDARDVMDIAEFFVVRGARGKNVGSSAAHALFTAFPGKWEIRVRRSNSTALAFWSRAVEKWLGRPVASTPFSTDGIDREVFRFESPQA